MEEEGEVSTETKMRLQKKADDKLGKALNNVIAIFDTPNWVELVGDDMKEELVRLKNGEKKNYDGSRRSTGRDQRSA